MEQRQTNGEGGWWGDAPVAPSAGHHQAHRYISATIQDQRPLDYLHRDAGTRWAALHCLSITISQHYRLLPHPPVLHLLPRDQLLCHDAFTLTSNVAEQEGRRGWRRGRENDHYFSLACIFRCVLFTMAYEWLHPLSIAI